MSNALDCLPELLLAFGHEYPADAGPRRAAEAALRGELDQRDTLRALLTIRQPGPIPASIGADLNALLDGDAAERGSVNAAGLPTLSSTHGVAGVLGERVALWEGDLTVLRADAIVNAANAQLLGCFIPSHRCIDNVIHAAAGPALRAETDTIVRARGGTLEPTGTAVLTAGYHLPASHVIHTVGPIVTKLRPSAEDASLLASCYRSVLDTAVEHDLATVGFCSISTGVFGYPKQDAAHVALETLETWFTDHPDAPQRAIVSLFAEVDVAAYGLALTERNRA